MTYECRSSNKQFWGNIFIGFTHDVCTEHQTRHVFRFIFLHFSHCSHSKYSSRSCIAGHLVSNDHRNTTGIWQWPPEYHWQLTQCPEMYIRVFNIKNAQSLRLIDKSFLCFLHQIFNIRPSNYTNCRILNAVFQSLVFICGWLGRSKFSCHRKTI